MGELNHIEAVRNRLLNKERKLENQLKEVRAARVGFETAVRVSADGEVHDGEMVPPAKARHVKAPVGESILEWAENTDAGRRGFGATEASVYLTSIGFKWENPFGSTYEACTRLEEKGKLVKRGPANAGKFYLPQYAPPEDGEGPTN